jgi:hypothetical protein
MFYRCFGAGLQSCLHQISKVQVNALLRIEDATLMVLLITGELRAFSH